MTEPPSLHDAPPTRSVERFVLTGPRRPLDPRVHAYRPDLADVALACRLFAPHYARAQPAGVSAHTVPLRDRPGGRAVSELVAGETFMVLDRAGGWAWGFCGHDDYVGYLPADALGEPVAATHVVPLPAALVFADADIKSPVVARWPMGTRFVAGAASGAFLPVATGYVHIRHAAAVDNRAPDPVALAETLVGTPYRWGGRSGDGIDCSGLVQRVLGLGGVSAPRDSDQQRAIGRALDREEALARGDLVFFPGHVGLMVDGELIVHANAHWMAVTVEPLATVLARAGGADALLDRRRPA